MYVLRIKHYVKVVLTLDGRVIQMGAVAIANVQHTPRKQFSLMGGNLLIFDFFFKTLDVAVAAFWGTHSADVKRCSNKNSLEFFFSFCAQRPEISTNYKQCVNCVLFRPSFI